MTGLSYADYIVLVVILIGTTLLGMWMSRGVHNLNDFIMPRRFNKFVMLMFSFGSGTHADQAVGVASKTFSNGLSGIWYQWLYLFASPFYWLIAPVMKRFRAITTADVFQARYDPSVATLFSIFSFIMLMVDIGVTLKSAGAIIDGCTGGSIPSLWTILGMALLFLIYGIAGGLSAAIITDLVQGSLTIIFSFMLLPMAMHAVGGVAGLHERLTDPQMFSLVAPADIGFFYVFMIALNGLVGTPTTPHHLSVCSSGRTEFDGRFGFMVGTLLKRVCTVAWTLTGLAAAALYIGQGINPDHIYGHVAQQFLPAILPGLLGLFLACLISSMMSACSAVTITASGLFTENLYKPILRGLAQRYPNIVPENPSHKHLVLVARLSVASVVCGGVSFALWVPSVIKGMEILWIFPAMMGVSFWIGLFWRRATVAGAWASTIVGIVVWWITTLDFFVRFVSELSFSESLHLLARSTADAPAMSVPWQMLLYSVSSITACIIVSLLTRPVDHAKLENFYALTRTPVDPSEELTVPCTLPKNVEPAPRDNFNTGFASLEIQRPSRVSMAGFLIGWLCVLALIGMFFIPGLIL